MKKASFLLFLFLGFGNGYAGTPFNQCMHHCQIVEKSCLNTCSCRARDIPSCSNQCVTSNTRCQTLCKAEQLTPLDKLPTTSLPNQGSDLSCKLAPETYQYW
jgi:hypothetical protein